MSDGQLADPVRNRGLFFEDYVEGMVFQHPFGRTVTEVDNTWFTLLTLNTNELHFNADAASRSDHGKVIVNSGLTVALVLGLSVSDMSQNALANLGWTDIKLSNPVFVGDTLYAESVVTAVRGSESRPHAGILTCFTRGLNHRGEEVVSWTRSVMILRSEAGTEVRRFPEPVVAIQQRLG